MGLGRLALNCELCLDQYNHQGWYGESFIQVLAAAAGLGATKKQPDCTGVDFEISATRLVRDDYPQIEVQVKSWSTPKGAGAQWAYRGLTEKRFNAIAGDNWRIPRLLFVVIVPDGGGYAEADDRVLKLSHAAYWVSLRHASKIPQPRCDRKIQVSVPKQNLLTVDTLIELCELRHAATQPRDVSGLMS
jgi:uncharacterized protein DUF4365